MIMDKNNFLTLVEAHKAGNQRAQQALYDYLWQVAKGVYVKKSFKNSLHWEDVEQQVVDKILVLFNHPYKEQEEKSPKGIVVKAFTNLFIDCCRTKGRAKEKVFSSFDSGSQDWEEGESENDEARFWDSLQSIAPAIADELDYRWLRALVKEGIAHLGKKQGQVLELILLEEYTPQMVMEALGCTRQQYDNNKRLGLENLQRWLMKRGIRPLKKQVQELQ